MGSKIWIGKNESVDSDFWSRIIVELTSRIVQPESTESVASANPNGQEKGVCVCDREREMRENVEISQETVTHDAECEREFRKFVWISGEGRSSYITALPPASSASSRLPLL